MEGLESSPERRVEANIQGGGALSQTDKQLQEFTVRYSDLTTAMTEWGVEARARSDFESRGGGDFIRSLRELLLEEDERKEDAKGGGIRSSAYHSH